MTPNRRRAPSRWISGLTPLLNVISTKMMALGLGSPRVELGPILMPAKTFTDTAGDRIRRGAVWHVGSQGRNCGFHVDFCVTDRINIEAWTGGSRRTSTWIVGDVTEASLKRDLTVCLVAAGLTDLARTEEVRAQLFTRTAKRT